jgi:hypothetical protein
MMIIIYSDTLYATLDIKDKDLYILLKRKNQRIKYRRLNHKILWNTQQAMHVYDKCLSVYVCYYFARQPTLLHVSTFYRTLCGCTFLSFIK